MELDLLPRQKFYFPNMHINICKTKILLGSLAVEVNHRSHENPLPAIQWNLLSLMPFVFIVFRSFLFPLLDHFAQLYPFHSLYSKLYLSILTYFFPINSFTEGGKIIFTGLKKLNTIKENCQFQLTTHNEAQQEKVSNGERSVKHSKIAQICKRQFCWNLHDNTWK